MQKKWKKKQQKAEREQREALKSERRAKLRDPQSKRGFRKVHIDGKVYLWRRHGVGVEIRTPGGEKWVAPFWQLQGHKSEAEWLKEHADCWEECFAYAAAPGIVRDFIIKSAGISPSGVGK